MRNQALRFWIVTAATLFSLAATFALGTWQVGRARQKLELHAAMEARRSMPPLDNRALAGGALASDWLHRPVVLRGTWSPGHTVFLDNRQMQGKPGFYVVTPLRLEGSSVAVLVERGWAPRNFVQRDKLPDIATPTGPVEVRGRMAPPPGKLYDFPGAVSGPIRQNLDLAQFRAETGLPLLGLGVQQTGAPADGLLRQWPEHVSGVEKHYGYAFQWWALCVLIAILYVWFQFIAPRRKARHA
jgi:surfeit locus 1 family protein